MPYEVLVKEAHTMIDEIPHEKIEYIIHILKDVRNLYSSETSKTSNTTSKKGFGCLHDKNFWMADDFDAPLDDFSEYM